MTEETWTLGRLLAWGTDYLKRQGSDSPRLDVQILLAHVTGLDRVGLYVHFDRPCLPAELTALRGLLKRRATGEPVAYITGQKEFFRRAFRVGPSVLVPRPETELLVDHVLGWLKARELTAPRIVDVGVGSGAIAVTLAAEVPGAIVLGVDISEAALEVAAQNAETHGVRERVRLAKGDALAPLKTAGSVDLVVSNPPYLDDPLMATLGRDVRDFEPHTALHGGADGLDVVRRLITDGLRVCRPGGLLAIEIAGTEQGQAAVVLLREAGWLLPALHLDLSRRGRWITAEAPGG